MRFIKLGEAATYLNGYAFKPSDWSNKGLPIIRIQNLTRTNNKYNYYEGEVSDKYIIRSGDILISWSASLGVYRWEGEKAVLNQHIFKVIFDKIDLDRIYFKYIVSYLLNRVKNYIHGSTMKHITKRDFDNLKIPLPPLEEQKRIAAILGKAQALIDKRKEAIAKLDELVQSVFLDMFGDPVTNPKGFNKGKIKDLISEAKYGTSKKAEEKGSFPYLRMNNLTYEGYMDFSDLKYINLEEKEQEKYLVRERDLLFNRTNSKELVGKTAVFEEKRPMAIAGYLIRVRTNNQGNPYYISGYLNSRHGKLVLQNMCKNIIGMANINAQEMQNINILLPPKDLQDQYERKYKLILSKKKQMEEQLTQLETNFQSLLQRAFRGELTQKHELVI